MEFVPFVAEKRTAVLAFLLAIAILWSGPTILAHALGNWGMIAFRDALLAETTRPDTSQQPSAWSPAGDVGAIDRRTTRMSTRVRVREIEQAVPKAMARWSDPWTAVMVFGRTLTTVAEAEALLVVDRGWGVDVWTVVNRSSSQTRGQLADKQWNFMQVFPDLDVDFHILDRRDEPLESFVRPSDYDVFIRLKADAHSGSTPSTD